MGIAGWALEGGRVDDLVDMDQIGIRAHNIGL